MKQRGWVLVALSIGGFLSLQEQSRAHVSCVRNWTLESSPSVNLAINTSPDFFRIDHDRVQGRVLANFFPEDYAQPARRLKFEGEILHDKKGWHALELVLTPRDEEDDAREYRAFLDFRNPNQSYLMDSMTGERWRTNCVDPLWHLIDRISSKKSAKTFSRPWRFLRKEGWFRKRTIEDRCEFRIEKKGKRTFQVSIEMTIREDGTIKNSFSHQVLLEIGPRGKLKTFGEDNIRVDYYASPIRVELTTGEGKRSVLYFGVSDLKPLSFKIHFGGSRRCFFTDPIIDLDQESLGFLSLDPPQESNLKPH